MASLNDYYTKSFSSFSGCDIKATFAGIEIGTLQAISYAVQREKAPIYVMGEVNPKAFSRGKRGIAGSMIFVMFDSHALLDVMTTANDGRFAKFVKDNDEISPYMFSDDADRDRDDLFPDEGDELDTWGDWSVSKAFYVDQLPPFDVTVVAMNEMGKAAVFKVWGAECLNEGYGISVDDMMSEMQTTYVARALTRWLRAGEKGSQTGPSPFTTEISGGGVVVEGPSRT
jgi:hypothetical protein